MKRSFWVCGLTIGFTLHAAQLRQDTRSAWDRYVQSVDAAMQARLRPGSPFLWIDEVPDRRQRLRAGEILVTTVGEHNPTKVPSGLIHHWMGAAFFPNAKVDDVLGVVRDYVHYKDYYNPTVVDSRAIQQTPGVDRFSMLLVNRTVLFKTALESEFESSYTQAGHHKWYSIATAVRLQEVEDYGQISERKLPSDEGSGYVWRLHNITRYEEADGGVYVEMEAMALSRDIPSAMRRVVDPVVRRVAKTAMLTSFRQTLGAVRSSGRVAGGQPGAPYGLASGFLQSRSQIRIHLWKRQIGRLTLRRGFWRAGIVALAPAGRQSRILRFVRQRRGRRAVFAADRMTALLSHAQPTRGRWSPRQMLARKVVQLHAYGGRNGFCGCTWRIPRSWPGWNPCRKPRAPARLVLNSMLLAGYALLVFRDKAKPHEYSSIARDWLPLLLILLAYREMGWFVLPHTDHSLEERWVVWDHALLRSGAKAVIESLGPVLPSVLEVAYLSVYALGPFSVVMLYVYGHRNRVDQFLVPFLVGVLLCYALFPFWPSEPPRTVFPADNLPAYFTVFRRWNLWLLGKGGIHTSVFPSGHVAAAFSATAGIWRSLPEHKWVGRVVGVTAVLISVATVYGRYHYLADATAGLLTAGVAFLIAQLFR